MNWEDSAHQIDPIVHDRQVDRRKLSTSRIVFLVVAAAAPLAAMVGNVPLALKLGNGPGLPGAFVLATVVLLEQTTPAIEARRAHCFAAAEHRHAQSAVGEAR